MELEETAKNSSNMMNVLEAKFRALEEENRILREHINDAKETGCVMKGRTQRSASESETENQTDEEAEKEEETRGTQAPSYLYVAKKSRTKPNWRKRTRNERKFSHKRWAH